MLSVDCWFFTLCVFLTTFHASKACNGYGLKVNKIESCADNSIITIENGNAVLDKDCNIVMEGCLVISKGFKTAKGKYVLKKPPMPPMEGELDFCESVKGMSDPQMESLAKAYGLPKNCPLPATKVCGDKDKKINISKYKNQIGIATGTTDIRLDVNHDVGRSCIDINVTIFRNRARG